MRNISFSCCNLVSSSFFSLVLTSCFLILFHDLAIAGSFLISQDKIKKYAVEFDHKNASKRFKKWQALIKSSWVYQSDLEKAILANNFINRIPFAEDSTHWGREDYWATPYEFIASNGGDCEDYSIAKYFTLRAMGIGINQLKIAYVKNVESLTPHMVLLFDTQNDAASPMVLDNLTPKIVSLAMRKEFVPVYSASEAGVWKMVNEESIYLGGKEILEKLSNLLSRM